MTAKTAIRAPEANALPIHGEVIHVPLNRLKASPHNARKTPHTAAAVEALAASIAAKGVLQPLTVAPERGPDGEPTGEWLVTIGEGRRQALALRAKRKEIRKAEPVRCVVDLDNDAFEISLDENVTRSDMHPADQFEAFRDIGERMAWGAEEIAARFGVTAQVVRQRLRLGAVSPKLMAIYREGGVTLDQLMAFAVSEDHARQEQVHDQLPSYNRHPSTIRRVMLESKVHAGERRVVFVGLDAYEAAGGPILRDLFTEDGGGWLEDVGLLDRLVAEKLEAEAERVRAAEGWKWAEAHLDYPHAHGLTRVYPAKIVRSEAEQAEAAALAEEYDALVEKWDAVEDLPPDVDARLKEIDAALDAFGEAYAYRPEDVARAGVFVVLGHDADFRIERGFVRAEDVAPEPAEDAPNDAEEASGSGEREPPVSPSGDDEDDGSAGAALSDRLVADLTAHRTQGLREALARTPDVALTAVVHALTLRSFYPGYDQPTPLEIKLTSAVLAPHAPGVEDTGAGRAVAARHEAWAARMPKASGEAWDFVAGLGSGELLDLLAHCASLSLDAVRQPHNKRPGAWALADRLSGLCRLDMTTTWTPTVASYLGRVTKAHIGQAVREAVGEEAASRVAGLRKGDMAAEAETLLKGTGWLPSLLRTPAPTVTAQALGAGGQHPDDAAPVGAIAAE